MRSLLVASTAALLAAFTPASAGTVDDEQVWANLTVTGSQSGMLYFVEAQPRFVDGANRLSQLLLRGAIGVPVTKALSLHLGYLYLHAPVESGPDRHESRPFAQINWSLGQVGGGTLTTRTRIEHRTVSYADDTSWRLRSMIRYVHPLGDPKGVRGLAYLEPFVTVNRADWNRVKGFDQLRSFIGLELPLPGKSTIEAGYLNQRVNAAGPINRSNHIAMVALFIRPQ